MNQTSAAAETDATKTVTTHRVRTQSGFAPASKVRDAKIAISLFDEQGLQNSGLETFDLSRQPQTRALYVKLAVQVQKLIILASREF